MVAVLFQQVVQTLLALVWLEDDSDDMGPFRNHQGSVEGYQNLVGGLIGKKLVNLVGRDGMESIGNGIYWWAIPIFQLFFAS